MDIGIIPLGIICVILAIAANWLAWNGKRVEAWWRGWRK